MAGRTDKEKATRKPSVRFGLLQIAISAVQIATGGFALIFGGWPQILILEGETTP